MLRRLLGAFRKRPIVIPDADKLAEGEARKVDVGDPLAGGTQVLLCRVDGRVYALDSLCPHEGGRLAPGPLEDGRIAVCPLHSYAFDACSGKVVRGSCRPARTYRVEEKGEEFELFL